MEETPREPPLRPGERVEHHEVTERVPPASAPGEPVSRRSGTPMWIWLLPLVLLVLFLAWYVFTRGEPNSPLNDIEGIEVEAPGVEAPDQVIEIEVPAAPEPPAASEAPAPAGETPPPAGEAPAQGN